MKRKCGGATPPHLDLLLAEGLTVGALVHGGVGLMGAHQDAIQRAVVLAVAVISALLYGAFNTLVCVAIHRFFLLLLNYNPIVRRSVKIIPAVAIWQNL